jgi:hypothetical protein
MSTEVPTLAELRRWQRRELIKSLEKITGAAASGPDHVRLRKLLEKAKIITKRRSSVSTSSR